MAELETADWKYLRTFRLIASTLTDGVSFADLSYRSSRSSNGQCKSTSLFPCPPTCLPFLYHPTPLWIPMALLFYSHLDRFSPTPPSSLLKSSENVHTFRKLHQWP